MNDTHLRELERELELTGALDARIAVAETRRQLGDYVGAATAIMPAAFEPNAEAVIRALAGPRPKTYANAVDLVAHKTFLRTDDLTVREAYLRRRIQESEFADALCELLPRLKEGNVYAEIAFVGNNMISLEFQPSTATPILLDARQSPGAYATSIHTAVQNFPHAMPLLKTNAQLRHLNSLIAADICSESEWRGTTLDGNREQDTHYGTGFIKDENALLFGFSNHRPYNQERHSGAHTDTKKQTKVTLLEPKGAQ